MDWTRVLDYVRYNSGTHLLDSGGTAGRAWQQPAPPEDQPLVYADDRHPAWGPTISTAAWLRTFIDEHAALTAAFVAFDAADDSNDNWFTLSDRFMHDQGYRQLATDNVYNNDNDFDQVFVWQVWVPADAPDTLDWIWADDAVVVYFIHTGADVRGGYSPPLFAHSCRERHNEYVLPIEWTVKCCPVDADDATRDTYWDATFWDVCDKHGDAVAVEMRDGVPHFTLGDGTVVYAELHEDY